VPDDLPLLYERIRAHLDARPDCFPADIAELEHTLTDGYARALALEGDRARAERQIADLAGRVDDPVSMNELRALADRRTEADADLQRLRALLELLRQRVEEHRAIVSS
jgi:bacterioferritin (cytochrome b1)